MTPAKALTFVLASAPSAAAKDFALAMQSEAFTPRLENADVHGVVDFRARPRGFGGALDLDRDFLIVCLQILLAVVIHSLFDSICVFFDYVYRLFDGSI